MKNNVIKFVLNLTKRYIYPINRSFTKDFKLFKAIWNYFSNLMPTLVKYQCFSYLINVYAKKFTIAITAYYNS